MLTEAQGPYQLRVCRPLTALLQQRHCGSPGVYPKTTDINRKILIKEVLR